MLATYSSLCLDVICEHKKRNKNLNWIIDDSLWEEKEEEEEEEKKKKKRKKKNEQTISKLKLPALEKGCTRKDCWSYRHVRDTEVIELPTVYSVQLFTECLLNFQWIF